VRTRKTCCTVLAPPILKRGIYKMETRGQFHVPAPLPEEKSPRYLFNNRVNGPRRRSGRFGEEKKLFVLLGREKISSVTQSFL